MRVGVDASNLREGGGITHLAQLLEATEPDTLGLSAVTVWSGRKTLDEMPSRPWLALTHAPELDGGLASRVAWQTLRLERAAREACDVLLVPGGSYAGRFRPFVTMSQNLLPFDGRARALFRPSAKHLKLLALRRAQAATFRRADGLVFLNEHARAVVLAAIGRARGRTAVVPHGVSARFVRAPREQEPIERYTAARPFRWLYVSKIDAYKHHPEVVRALTTLVAEGLPVSLDLVGSAWVPSQRRLERAIAAAGLGDRVRCHGPVPHHALHEWYARADGFVFASTCENMPIVLVEAMASGLPVACSRVEPMPSLAGDGAVLFDAEDPASIAGALRALLHDPARRARVAAVAHARGRARSWTDAARETFGFLREVRDAAPAAGPGRP